MSTRKGGRKLPSHITHEQAVDNLLMKYSYQELVKLEQSISFLSESAGNPVCLIATKHIIENAIRVCLEDKAWDVSFSRIRKDDNAGT